MRKIFTLIAAAVLLVILGTCSSATLIHESNNNSSDSILVDDGDYYILGGDILLDKRDPVHQGIIDSLINGDSETRAVKKETIQAWPNGEFHYWLDGDFTATDRANLQDAMDEWESVCGIRFIEMSSGGQYVYRIYKVVDPNIGGASTLGYSMYPYYKFVSNYKGTIMHELAHGMGFSHEHQRFDRDSYVTVNYDNIMEGYESNFAIIPEYLRGVLHSKVYASYDYDSIMHYPAYGFSDNGLPTIDAHGQSIGQRNHLSAGDIEGSIAVYGPAGGLYSKVYSQVYLRGTNNDWGVSNMQLVANNTWQIEVTFGSATNERFKFDINGDWGLNFGDNNGDGYCEQWGADIPVDEGTKIITFNDKTKSYTVKDGAVETTINVVYDCGWGNAMYVRGDKAPLSWSSGQLMSWTSGNVWTWSTLELDGSFQCKSLINNHQWQQGSNVLGQSGDTVTIYPYF
jgi:hypothetical protein